MQHVQIEVATRADLADILNLIRQSDMSPDNNLSFADAAVLFESMQAKESAFDSGRAFGEGVFQHHRSSLQRRKPPYDIRF